MSRTVKGKKNSTREYWSRRELSRCHGAPTGKVTKQLTAAKERAVAKQALLKEPREPEFDEREYVPTEPDSSAPNPDPKEEK